MFRTLRAKLAGAKRSLTIWFNTLMATAVLLLPEAQDAFPQMQAYLGTDLYRWAMGLIIAGNIALRFKTVVDLAEKAAK